MRRETPFDSEDRVPGAAEWGEPTDIDERYTKRRFYGWSLADAEAFFTQNPSGSEELFYMPRAVFLYYLPAFKASVCSKKHTQFTRMIIHNNITYCISQALDKRIPEITEFIEIGRLILADPRYFLLNREARMQLRLTIRHAIHSVRGTT